MKILYLTNKMGVGGVEKCILKLCKMHDSRNVFVISSGGELVNDLKKQGVKHYKIKDPSSKNPITLINNIQYICRIIDEEGIQVIHSHHRMTTLYAKMIMYLKHIKVIHSQHLCLEDKFGLTRIILKDIPIITVSKSAKKILIEKCKLKSGDIQTIYNTVETENKGKESDRVLKELSEKYFIVAQISRVIDYKGVYDFVDIAEATCRKEANIRFILIGDGPDLENLKKYVISKGISQYIYLLGPKDNIIDCLKYINILTLCSYIEGLPLAPLEAFSQNIPVIGTNIAGTNEEIFDGLNGYLVEPKDIEEFKEKILTLYRKEELYKEMCENSKKIYDLYFNETQYFKNHEQIYKNLK